MNVLFRKSSSMAATPSKQALSALLFFESSNFSSSLPIREFLFPRSRPLSGDLPAVDCSWALERTGFSIRCREFHLSAGALGFRASDIARAEYAVADFSDEEMAPGKKYSGNVDDEGLEISKLGISHEIVSALSKKGITKLFPIQKAVLEPAMQGRDMIGRARTGTGKTLAFGIPILDRIIQFNAKHGRGRNPLALVMAPTRELARQVEKEFSESSSLDTICVYGGVPISSQMRTLNYGVDVVVGTPGRIMDLFNRGALNLSEVQFIVLDEADQMFDVGFGKDVEAILDSLPQKRQTMMFSATMPSWIQNLTRKHMKDPVTIDLVGDSDQKLADGIALYSIASDSYGKSSILGPLITEHARGGKCIVFTQTKRDADRLAYSMNRSLRCEALHGDISQNQRERTLSGFRDGLFNVLIATDVAARGLDIPNVDLVIHYELPNTSEIFVHRSGRTGRAGKKGSAILIYTEQQTRAVRGIEQDVGCKFKELPRITVEGGSQDMSHDMNGGRFGSFGGGRSRTSDFGSSGGSGGSQFGRFGDFGGSSSSRFGSFGGSSSSRPGGFGDSSPGRSGGLGGSGFSRSGGFGDNGSGRSGGFGDNGSGRSGGFGDSGSSRFGGYGSGHSSRFGDSNLSRSSGFGDSVSSHSGSFGKYGSERSSSYGDSSSSYSSGFNDFGPSHFGGSRSKRAGGFDGFGNDGVDE